MLNEALNDNTEQETTQELSQNMVLIVSNLCHSDVV